MTQTAHTPNEAHCQSSVALKWSGATKTVRFEPHNYLAADLRRIDAALWGREDEIGTLIAAAPELLADARALLNTMETPRCDKASAAWYKLMQTVAKATGQAVQS